MAQPGVVVRDVAEHRDEHQEEREHREEPVVGDQRRELAAAVVAVLLDDADDERRTAVALLPAVDTTQELHQERFPGTRRRYSLCSNPRIRSVNDGSIAGPVSITTSCSVPVHGNGGS